MPGTSLCPLDASDQLPRSPDESCVSSIWLRVPSPSVSLVSDNIKACIWSLESYVCLLTHSLSSCGFRHWLLAFCDASHASSNHLPLLHAMSLCQEVILCSFSLFRAMLTFPGGLFSPFRADSNAVQVLACSRPI